MNEFLTLARVGGNFTVRVHWCNT